MVTTRKGLYFTVITDMLSQEPQEAGATGVDGHDSDRDSDVGSDSEIHDLSDEKVLLRCGLSGLAD